MGSTAWQIETLQGARNSPQGSLRFLIRTCFVSPGPWHGPADAPPAHGDHEAVSVPCRSM